MFAEDTGVPVASRGGGNTAARSSDKTLLVGIGAQRSGTTWLSRYLAAHPAVFMSPMKEMRYFDVRSKPEMFSHVDGKIVELFKELAASFTLEASDLDEVERMDAVLARIRMMMDANAYRRFFETHVGDRPVMCEISPSYSVLDRTGFAAIGEAWSRVKFAFLMRNPIERAWSQIQMRAGRMGLQTEAAFEADLDEPHVALRTDYQRTLTELAAVAPSSEVFLEFFERLFDDRAIARLSTFAEIDFRKGDYQVRVGASAVPSAVPLSFRRKAFAKFEHVYDYIHDLFGGDIPSSWKQDMATFG